MKLPKGWTASLGEEISVLITKGESPRWQGFEYQSEGAIFVTSENVRDGRLDISFPKFIPIEFHAKLKRSALRCDDILINLVGASIGRSCRFSLQYAEANINQAVCLLRLKPGIDPSWVSLYLQEPSVVRRLIGNNGDSARANISLSDIRNFTFVLPPLTERRKIAEILSTWDEALEKLDALIEAKERSKKALMQQLLSRAAARSGRTHARHRLGEIVERVTRKNTILNDRVLTISAQGGLVDQREYFSRNVAGADLSGYYLLKKGEFVYNRSSSKGYPFGALKRLDQYDAGVVSTLYLCFRIKSDAPVSSEYLCHYCEGGRLNFGLRSIAKEGARAHGLLNVTADEFFDLDIFLPSLGDQQKIAIILDTADQELALLQNQRTALGQQKRGLMQRLLTGRIRVKTNDSSQ